MIDMVRGVEPGRYKTKLTVWKWQNIILICLVLNLYFLKIELKKPSSLCWLSQLLTFEFLKVSWNPFFINCLTGLRKTFCLLAQSISIMAVLWIRNDLVQIRIQLFRSFRIRILLFKQCQLKILAKCSHNATAARLSKHLTFFLRK